MGWISRAVAAGGEHRTALSEVEEGLFVDQGDTRAKLSQFWMLLILSSLIAAGGVVGNSTPAVIGAMIVAPWRRRSTVWRWRPSSARTGACARR